MFFSRFLLSPEVGGTSVPGSKGPRPSPAAYESPSATYVAPIGPLADARDPLKAETMTAATTSAVSPIRTRMCRAQKDATVPPSRPTSTKIVAPPAGAYRPNGPSWGADGYQRVRLGA